ncbi:MAG TPA: hypothetical protein VEW93_15335 [Acidimicrobiales bacterium]|nr:hypothetical protein [Acidimicrobiales bacterium]
MTSATRAPEAVAPWRRADRPVLPGGTFEDPTRRGAAFAGVLVAAAGLALYGSSATTAASVLSLSVVSGLALPLWLVALRPRRAALVGVALLALLVPLAVRTADLAAHPGPQESAHDGGVHVTRAGAEDLLAGRNPYAQPFADDLPPAWARINVVPGQVTPNPVVDHLPYLPGAVLVAVPGVLLERALGVGGDPRWVMGLFVLAAVVALARRPEEAWARAAAIVAFGSASVVVYAAWGTNDAAAAALVVLAALGARRHPGWAGAALALAVSYKAPLALGLVPWAVWVVRRDGWAGLRPWGTAPALLAATTLPFLAWSPGDLVTDTLRFWTGTTGTPFPASGLGLGYRAPDLMESPLGPVVTVALAAAGLAGAVALARRVAHPAVLPVASALVLLGLLVPARTFQPNYLGLLSGCLACGWLLAPGARLHDGAPAPVEMGRGPTSAGRHHPRRAG